MTTKIAGEEFYEVTVEHAAVRKVHWFLSTKDFLPRRVDHLKMKDGQSTGGTRIVVTSLQADPKIPKSAFEFKLPAGFQEIADVAP